MGCRHSKTAPLVPLSVYLEPAAFANVPLGTVVVFDEIAPPMESAGDSDVFKPPLEARIKLLAIDKGGGAAGPRWVELERHVGDAAPEVVKLAAFEPEAPATDDDKLELAVGDITLECVRSVEVEGARGSGRRREVVRALGRPELHGLPVRLAELGNAAEERPRRGAEVLTLADLMPQRKTVSRREFDVFAYTTSTPAASAGALLTTGSLQLGPKVPGYLVDGHQHRTTDSSSTADMNASFRAPPGQFTTLRLISFPGRRLSMGFAPDGEEEDEKEEE